MLYIRHNITDPCINIAAEEYFLQESQYEYFLLYSNEPSVIIGKHQNAYAEINYDFIRKNNFKVVRRISGGGAVWHDPGNLNFSFIGNGKPGELVNFRKYMQPVLDFLTGMGLNANFEGKNSISVNGYKVSGNAEHVYKNRILHHGTLLFNTNLAAMAEALGVDPHKYHDRAVKSVRSNTTNISDQLNRRMNISEFGDVFFRYIVERDAGGRIIDLEDSDHHKIQILADNKYSKWEWNFGYSPPYELKRIINIAGSSTGISLQVEKGRIIKIKITGNFPDPSLMNKLEAVLTGQKHREETITGILKQDEFVDLLNIMDIENWIKMFF